MTNLGASDLHRDDVLDLGCAQRDTCREETISSAGFSQKSSVDVPVELLERVSSRKLLKFFLAFLVICFWIGTQGYHLTDPFLKLLKKEKDNGRGEKC